jgi:mRNA interferase RelE/StbE
MGYELRIDPRAEHDLRRLDRDAATRVASALRRLSSEAESARHYALTGPLRGLYRIRAGDYRALYQLDHDARAVIVLEVGHRSEAYREK